MTSYFVAASLLGLSSLAIAANFTQVFECNELDYEWPSDPKRAQALQDGTFKPEEFYPGYMAVYGERIFLSLEKFDGVPVTLVTMPTSSASSAPPKLTPFPSWDMYLNESGNCSKIERPVGLQVDSVGRLWVLEERKFRCGAKLWIFDVNDNKTELIHQFPIHDTIHDLVIDETANETFAYITRWIEKHILVFSLERNESWIVDTPGINVFSIAKDLEPRRLYLSNHRSNELYSIPIATLRKGTQTANPRLIGNWTEISAYRMLMDNRGTLYAAFLYENFTSSWNTSQPFQEERFYQVAGLKFVWPFTFALDQNGTLWMTVFDKNRKPKYRLLKAALGAKSYTFKDSPECSSSCLEIGTA
ncbi:protein yellow-like [Cloeon dipterum]|uniref:protein yellow-like n=1 Tax=Cloeon dipterum TaxID=197152 RepID=UPI00322071F9